MDPQSSSARRGAPVRVRGWARALGGLAALAGVLGSLTGCASGKHASAAVEPAQTSCAATVVEDLAHVLRRIYREGVSSERTLVAQRFIASSPALKAALASGDAAAAQSAVRALVAGGHMTNLRLIRNGTVLANAGGAALAPISGRLPGGASGAQPDSTYVASVWSDEGFLDEAKGVSEGTVVLRAGAHTVPVRAHGGTVGGSLALPPGKLPPKGSIVIGGVPYAYASFGAIAFPHGHVRVYLFRTVPSTAALCASSREATTLNTMSRVARRIYEGEAGRRTLGQVRRVQANTPLLLAVARHDPVAARRAVEALLNEHIVRLRVYADGAPATPAGPAAAAAGGASGGGSRLLVDDGGPYVLAPVSAPLRLNGHLIGHFVLSIQDDEGYMRLTRRLAGLRVLMYMAPDSFNPATLVKNSLGPDPGAVPASGRYTYRGSTFQVYTLHARAFPSGPLTVRVLVPVPFA
jgi:DNA-binding GntR family transcriptional regulator